jgi:hypothetical protein
MLINTHYQITTFVFEKTKKKATFALLFFKTKNSIKNKI